jgi:hypothetical protein
MQPQSPQSFTQKVAAEVYRWAASVKQVLDANVDMGTPTGNAPNSAGINAGVYTQFEQGNSTGVLIRIAANGVTGTGAPYNWAGANVGVVINHGLLRKPIGFKIVDKDKTVDVYRTAAPDKDQITLAPTDNTASVTVYVF